jgi:pimeloyl-ACP methyl ester carboxylesterase
MTTPQTFILPDGRALMYQEFGEPAGNPLFYFHGLPGSRLDLLMMDPAVFSGLRILAVDRPGIGGSDFQPGRTFLDWPDDIAALAGSLDLHRFKVLGVSGGGPYALVCAAVLPEQVEIAGSVSSIAPLNVPGLTKGIGPGKIFFHMARWLPFFVDMQLNMMRSWVAKDRGAFLKRMAGSMPLADQEILANERVCNGFMDSMAESLRCGNLGTRYDAALYMRPWPFELAKIMTPVYLWHGEADRNAPVAMGRYLAENIPNCTGIFFPGEGHLSALANHEEENMAILRR